jgi:hypothetical protein
MMQPLTLSLLPETLAVCRLDPDISIPAWALSGGFFSVTRTRDELSVVCLQRYVPKGVDCERGWRYLKVEGPLDFSLVGILACLTASLASAGISVFAISTYDTDYLLVKAGHITEAVQVLSAAGHLIDPPIR